MLLMAYFGFLCLLQGEEDPDTIQDRLSLPLPPPAAYSREAKLPLTASTFAVFERGAARVVGAHRVPHVVYPGARDSQLSPAPNQ